MRKVRYFDDLEAAIGFTLENEDELFVKEDFTSCLIKRRSRRHNLTQKHYRRGIERTKRSLYSTKFNVTLPDTLKFLEEVRILGIESGRVRPLELARKWVGDANDLERRKLVLEFVLNSKYKAYFCYLQHLTRLNEFIIPAIFKRNRRFGDFISKKGFRTDVASFYTIRDLLYELDAVNWLVDDEGRLVIYPTISLDGENVEGQWYENFRINGNKLYLWRKLEEQVTIDQLIEIYLDQTGRRYMINADLLHVRDIFCRRFRIGDNHFRKILLRCIEREEGLYRISLNFGAIRTRKPNYNLKILSLPRVSSDRLALYITIDKEAL